MSKVNVLMTVYNDGERLLTESIESILKQTYTHFKFVIVNDGSNDATHEIVSKYAEIDERIVYVYRNINKGRTYSLNEGLQYCEGDFIFINDSDDISHNERLMESISYYENDILNKSNFGLLGTGFISNELSINKKTTHYLKGYSFFRNTLPMWRLLIGMPYPHSSIMYSKTALMEVGGFSREVSAGIDYLTLIKIANKYDIYGLNKILVERVIDGNNFFMQQTINNLSVENTSTILEWQKNNIRMLQIKKIPYYLYTIFKR